MKTNVEFSPHQPLMLLTARILKSEQANTVSLFRHLPPPPQPPYGGLPLLQLLPQHPHRPVQGGHRLLLHLDTASSVRAGCVAFTQCLADAASQLMLR